MDVLNFWQDDPEEVLLDLGFGSEEPDLSVRIPARFINHQSKARGINVQVFLEAQKNRMDVENPDISNRFRQLEVLQQVTTAFSSLVGGGGTVPPGGDGAQDGVSAETREKRKRLGMLLRRASKKTMSQTRNSSDRSSPAVPSPEPATPPLTSDRHGRRSRTALSENMSLSPLLEEQSPASDLPVAPPTPLIPLVRKGSPVGEPVESFEMEEIQSFDEGSAAGICVSAGEGHCGTAQQVESVVLRTNSCQSDSSGFLEEPIIPAPPPAPAPNAPLMKVLNAISISTDNQSTPKESQDLCCSSTDSSSTSLSSIRLQEASPPQSSALPYACLPVASSASIMGGAQLSQCCEAAEGDLGSGGRTQDAGVVAEDLRVSGRGLVDCSDGDDAVGGPAALQLSYRIDSSVQEGCISTPPGHQLKDVDSTSDSTPDSALSPFNSKGGVGSPMAIPGPDRRYGLPGRSVSVQMRSALDPVSQTAVWRGVSIEPRPQAQAAHRQDSDTEAAEPRPLHVPELNLFQKDLGKLRARSVSLDTGLSYEDDARCEDVMTSPAACRHCCCCRHTQAVRSPALPFSLDELEGMIRCMRKFRSILGEIEERLDEEQASVYSSLSDEHREEVQDVLELRAAVRQEARELELQLAELVHHYDDSFKMKIHRLLDEQSLLCSQLSIVPSNSPAPAPPSVKSVATQCSLLPGMDAAETRLPSQWTNERRPSGSGPDGCSPDPQQQDWRSGAEGDKMNFNSLLRSFSKDSLM